MALLLLLLLVTGCRDRNPPPKPGAAGAGTGAGAAASADPATLENYLDALRNREWPRVQRYILANRALLETQMDGRTAVAIAIDDAPRPLDENALNLLDPSIRAQRIKEWEQQVAVAVSLINQGAVINQPNRNGDTPLHAAAGRDLEPLVLALLKKQANVNATNGRGQTPLFLPSDVKVARLLLRFVANANAADDRGTTAVAHHARARHPEIVKLLLENGARVDVLDRAGRGPLFYAALDDAATIEALMDKDADPKAVDSALGRTALHDMAADPSIVPQDPGRGLGLLVSKGADVLDVMDKKGDAPLHLALRTGKAALARELLARGANPAQKTADGRTSLHCAAEGGDAGLVQSVLNRGIDANAPAADGGTPLLSACRASKLAAVRVLLEAGADPNRKNQAGQSPLGYLQRATDPQSKAIVDLLKEKGATE